MSSLESFEELLEDVLLRLFSSDHVRVLLSIIICAHVIDVDEPGSIGVQLVESLGNNSLSAGVHGSTDSAKEFVVVDLASSVVVKSVEQHGYLALREAKEVVLHSFGELIFVKAVRVVIIHNSELFAEADDAASTTGSKLVSQASEQLLT